MEGWVTGIQPGYCFITTEKKESVFIPFTVLGADNLPIASKAMVVCMAWVQDDGQFRAVSITSVTPPPPSR